MLEGQHGGRHEHRHLLGVARRLEGSTYGHLGLAEAHIAAHQTVHGSRLLHVHLHIIGRLQLVGRVFVEERSLQLMLQVVVGRESEPLLVSTACIEFDEVACDVLDAFLGAFLHALPRPCAQCAQSRRLAGVAAPVFGNLVKRVYGHVDHVAPLVDDAYHLLVAVARGHAHQSEELAHTEVDVHHEVAGFHLLQFLHGERHLSHAGGIRLEVVLMETVEYLVVGEETSLQVVVDEPLVECAVDRLERQGGRCEDIVGGRVEDILQPLYLFLAVGQDIESIPLGKMVLQRLREQRQVLMEQRLRCDMEGHRRIGFRLGSWSEGKPSELVYRLDEILGTEQGTLSLHFAGYLLALHLRGLLHAFGECLVGEAVGIDLGYGVAHIHIILHHDERIVGQELEERDTPIGTCRQFGHDVYLLLLLLRQLALHLEGADGVDLVVEEINAEGQFAAKGIDIEDAPSDGELTWFVHIILFVEPQREQSLAQVVHVDHLSLVERDHPFVELAFRHHEFRESLGMGNHQQRFLFAPRGETCKHLGAQYLVSGIALSVFHRPFIG